MSDVEDPITETIRFRDPRITLEHKPPTIIDQGAENIDVRRSPSTTYTDSLMSFSDISCNSTSLCLDRKIFVEYSYYVSLRAGWRSVGGAAADILFNQGGGAVSPGSADTLTILRANNAADMLASLNGAIGLYGALGPDKNVGPRSLGLSQSCKNLTVTINGTPITARHDYHTILGQKCNYQGGQ